MTRTELTNALTIFLAGLFVILAVAAFYAWKATSRDAYEMAEYQILEADRVFEIRVYPELLVASTSMKPDENDGSFLRLFRYISGDNAEKQKIAMTVPVFMAPSANEQTGQMSFVLPRVVAEAPAPADELVTVAARNAGRFAVIRFAGGLTERSISKAQTRLRDWMRQKNLAGAGAYEIAGYDPPWTPAVFRRNEVLIGLE